MSVQLDQAPTTGDEVITIRKTPCAAGCCGPKLIV